MYRPEVRNPSDSCLACATGVRLRSPVLFKHQKLIEDTGGSKLPPVAHGQILRDVVLLSTSLQRDRDCHFQFFGNLGSDNISDWLCGNLFDWHGEIPPR